MVSSNLFHCRRNSWPAEEYVGRTALQLLDFDGGSPPEQAWRRRLNSHANLLKEFSVTFMEAMRMMSLGLRLWSYVREEASHGRKAPIDPFTKEKCKPSASQGVPLGGMGSGSISRGFRGEFKNWHIIPGLCETSPVMENQFSIFVSRDGGNKKFSSVLSPGHHEGLRKCNDDSGISSWDWNLSGQHSTYHALFPRAWTVYDGEPDPDLKISCRQISPFIPHDYKDSSLPTSVFVYTLVNTGKDRAKVSLLMTWANSIGGFSHHSGGHFNEPFIAEDGVSGVLLHHKTAKDNPPVTFAIAACETQNVNVTVLPVFGLSGEGQVSAKQMWDKMAQNGHFERENFEAGSSMPSSSGETLCAAVSASTWVEPHGRCTVVFGLAWSSPKIKFQKGCTYNRRYTEFYGTSERSAVNLVHDALTKYKIWEEEIEKWQNPILKNERLPEWYKFTLFNELYFLVAGGTVWTDGQPPMIDEKTNPGSNQQKSSKRGTRDNKQESVKDNHVKLTAEQVANGGDLTDGEERSVSKYAAVHGSQMVEPTNGLGPQEPIPYLLSKKGPENVGKFLYLEGVEYIMWCTYDVHFYASFALLDLFPKIELSIQRDFANAVLYEDRRRMKFLADGTSGIRKVKGAVPHDLGTHDPWHEMNAYNIHDTSKWKDLNPKFVLQVYRDFAATGDMSFGRDVWPAVCAAMDYMDQFDRDGDGLIENDGFPDQTYDAWTVHGISAYCGGLWLAALQAAATMAHRLGDRAFAEKYKLKFIKAKAVYEAKLWNGSYFNYDSGTSSNSRSIQADQLAGQWYAASSGLPPLFDEQKIRSALQKIFEFNVMKVKGGRLGAVNGMTPSGKVDETCMQSREIWTGVTYGVAANMLLHGMEHQAFTTAEGIFIAGWSEDGYGYWFQTPEGWTMDGHYRSLIYMRPLAVWAMQWALSPPKAILDAPKVNLMDRIHLSPQMIRAMNEISVRKIAPDNRCFPSSAFRCQC
ncbi:non-lysosomal glucosylceramidase-like isoform X1 [Oryza brachyantha]|uniref:Non-lysosomal glucosylceramidase n=1 Tax=Oryza brachyantha TaxID=4533 RepID=J3N3C6_ORYBR|nr:non-lysosomal glucosylceramidase-like isoform X1 [Oryza brachyantha]